MPMVINAEAIATRRTAAAGVAVTVIKGNAKSVTVFIFTSFLLINDRSSLSRRECR